MAKEQNLKDAPLKDLLELIVSTTMDVLEKRGLISVEKEKTAYQKTEQLLFNYRGFKRIVQERYQEIEDIRKYGVPQRCGNVGERVQSTPVQIGLVLPEESVDAAIATVERSVQDTVQVISLIDKAMSVLKNDPYYGILEMRYFEGRTQEDIALEYKCNQATIARNKSRLVRDLAMQLFPDQVAREIMGN